VRSYELQDRFGGLGKTARCPETRPGNSEYTPLFPNCKFRSKHFREKCHASLRAAGEFLAALKHVSAVRLLAYHALARAKFAAVGHPDTMPDVPPPTREMLERAAEILRGYGLNVLLP